MFIEIVALEQLARRRLMVSCIAGGRKDYFKSAMEFWSIDDIVGIEIFKMNTNLNIFGQHIPLLILIVI